MSLLHMVVPLVSFDGSDAVAAFIRGVNFLVRVRESCMQISCCKNFFQLDMCSACIVAPGICATVEADARQM